MTRKFFSGEHMFSSIRSKFIVIFVSLGLLPLLFVGSFSYNSASNALILQTREQLGNLADKTAQQIDTFFEVVEKDINLLSDFPFIQLSFLQYEFGQRMDTVQRLIVDYEKKHPYYKRIHLVSLEGQSILTVPGNDKTGPESFYSSDWFRSALKNDIYLSDIITCTPFSDSFLIITKKIYDFEFKDKPVGILVFEIKLSSFTSFVSSVKIGDQGYAFLINEKGYMIYHPDPNLRDKDTVLKLGDKKLEILIEQMQTGEHGFGDYFFKGQPKYMVATQCKTKPWSIGITLMRSEFMADILKLRQSMLTFNIIVILLLIIVSILFAKSLTQPIKSLINGACAIGAGDLDQVITVESSDELKELAKEFNNMTVRLKTSMQEIVELKTFSDDIFRSVSNGIVTVDRSGTITSMNKSAEEILSFTWVKNRQQHHPKPSGIQKTLVLLMSTLEKEKQIEHKVIDYINPQKEHVYIEINTSLLNNSNGVIIGAIADIRDITLRKQMEELIIRVEKLASLGELSAGIAHEIRNPLAGMKTSIQVLAKELSDPSQQILLEGVLSEINRLNNIVTDLLKFSGSSPSFPGPVQTSEIIQKALDLLTEKIRSQRIEIVKNYDQDILLSFVDKEQIQQVFLNLMLNAITAMPDGGTLTIEIKKITNIDQIKKKIPQSFESVKTGFSLSDPVPPDYDLQNFKFLMENEYISVSFKDTGVGIKSENLPKIFNPFFTTYPNGTGLGLSIAHKLLEKNKAYIFIDSKEGKGCHVTLILPIAEEPADSTPSTAMAAQTLKGAEK